MTTNIITDFRSNKGLPTKGNPRLIAAELFSSGVCNLNCSYCFIPKDEMMKEYHTEILNGLDDGNFIKVLNEVYDKNLEAMSFWGTEPSLSLEKIGKNLESFFKAFPKLNQLSFSTNFVSFPEKIISFAKEIERLATQRIRFNFQISIDGPEWITDTGRGKDVTRRILKNLDFILEEMKTLKLEKVDLSFHFKATVDMDIVRIMNDNPEKIKEWYLFFEEIVKKIELARQDFVSNISVAGMPQPTLVVPGKYTSQDGKDLAIFYENIYKLAQEFKEGNYSDILKKPLLNLYTYRMLNVLNSMDEILDRPENITCSGFDTQAGIDLEGNLMPCHRFFLFKNEKYVKGITGGEGLDDWDVSLFNLNIVKNIQKYLMPNIFTSSEKEIARYSYIGRTYHDFIQFRNSQIITMLKAMARAGQASPIYAEDDQLCFLFALFLNSVMACPVENYLNTGSINITPVSMIRILANGAFEQVLYEALEIKGVV